MEDTSFLGSKPASVPIDPDIKLSASDGDLLPDGSIYRRLIGRLLYLTISWPDITFAVNKLSQYMSKPCTSHLHAVHNLLRYLKGTLGQSVLFSSKSSIQLHGYADVDWGNAFLTLSLYLLAQEFYIHLTNHLVFHDFHHFPLANFFSLSFNKATFIQTLLSGVQLIRPNSTKIFEGDRSLPTKFFSFLGS